MVVKQKLIQDVFTVNITIWINGGGEKKGMYVK